jgi:RNA polymerase sigma-70 factor (ECF subfamily)
MNAFAQLATTTADGTAELLSRAQAGDRDAFTELVERHHPDLVRIAYAITGDLDAARDSAQLAWIKAWQRLPSVREPDRLRSWLIAIAANEARQHIRASRRRRVREIAPISPESETTTAAPEPDRLDLSAALSKLGASDRQLLAMRYLAGMSSEEIASLTGRSASGTRTRLSRLVGGLREELNHE